MKVGSTGVLDLSRVYPKTPFETMFYSWWNCPLNSNNECSLESAKGRQIISLHKKRRQNIKKKKFFCFWKTVEFFFGMTVEKKK